MMVNNNNNNNNNNTSYGRKLPRPPYQVYWDLGKIDPYSVKTQEDEDNYYKSLLYGCRDCDRIGDSILSMVCHFCSNNGKSKYEQHEQEALNRKIKKIAEMNTNKNHGG